MGKNFGLNGSMYLVCGLEPGPHMAIAKTALIFQGQKYTPPYTTKNKYFPESKKHSTQVAKNVKHVSGSQVDPRTPHNLKIRWKWNHLGHKKSARSLN